MQDIDPVTTQLIDQILSVGLRSLVTLICVVIGVVLGGTIAAKLHGWEIDLTGLAKRHKERGDNG